jgi:hypothetical protein
MLIKTAFNTSQNDIQTCLIFSKSRIKISAVSSIKRASFCKEVTNKNFRQKMTFFSNSATSTIELMVFVTTLILGG